MKNYPVLAVCSGKGGVGKSSISFYLAKLLSQHNYNVGLIDADIYGPSLHLMFENLGNNKPEQLGSLMTPAVIDNIQFISGAFIAPGGAFIRAPKANGIIKSFFEQVAWENLDILIVDFPPGTGDIPLSLFQEQIFDAALVVTTPHTLSVEDAAKSTVQLQQAGIPLLGVIENMSYIENQGSKLFPFGKGGGQELADIFNTSILMTLPIIDQSSELLSHALLEKMEKKIAIFEKLIKKSKNNLSACCK